MQCSLSKSIATMQQLSGERLSIISLQKYKPHYQTFISDTCTQSLTHFSTSIVQEFQQKYCSMSTTSRSNDPVEIYRAWDSLSVQLMGSDQQSIWNLGLFLPMLCVSFQLLAQRPSYSSLSLAMNVNKCCNTSCDLCWLQLEEGLLWVVTTSTREVIFNKLVRKAPYTNCTLLS